MADIPVLPQHLIVVATANIELEMVETFKAANLQFKVTITFIRHYVYEVADYKIIHVMHAWDTTSLQSMCAHCCNRPIPYKG